MNKTTPMITPIEAAELMAESPERRSLEEILVMAVEIVRLSARIGVGSAAIPVPTERLRDVVKAITGWGFTPHWQSYNTGWSSVVVNLQTLAWFSPEDIAADRARRQVKEEKAPCLPPTG